ncbi:copper resistance protein CopC [Brachybacterium endophyticum]|uniref:copper resistance protein CopC n=1 Tax=Brachybacterium endophyticum TaxID=2182385 RepID=UPI0010580345|nr:copper resistance protein CopC [Brachybacterium endophyticum]
MTLRARTVRRRGSSPETPRRRAARLALGTLLGLLLLLTGATPALAHAQLEDSTPGDGAVVSDAPRQATLTFDEHVRPVTGATSLIRPDGSSTALAPHARDDSVVTDLPDDLPKGSYTLTYRVVSADGHPVAGAVTFSVGAPSSPSDTSTASASDMHEESGSLAAVVVGVLTVLQYVALLVTVGILLCAALVTRSQAARSVLASPRATRILRGLALVAAAASVLLVPVSAADAAGWSHWVDGLARQQVLGAVAVVLGAALVIVAGGARRPVLAVPGALLALLAPMLVGHSASIGPRPLMLVADAAHLLAGAVWSGGMIGTIAVLAALRRDGSTDEAVAVVRRFSLAALISVLALAASGIVMAVLILDSPSGLVTTPWGRTLLIKLVVVAVTVGLAAWNRTRLLPAVTTASAPWEQLLRLMRREAALLIGVLVVTGALVNLSPHEHSMDSMSRPQPVHASSQGLTVDGTVEPGTRGKNTLTVTLTYRGDPLQDRHPRITATQEQQDIGPITAHPSCDGDGSCTADLTLPASGSWQVQVTSQVDEFTSPVATFPLDVR